MRRNPEERASVRKLVLVVTTLALAAPLEAQSMQSAEGPPPAYILRATSQWATAINEVLARVAQPVEIVIPADKKALEFLSQLCAGKPPQHEEMGMSERGQKIRISPCIRVRRDVKVDVTTGDTLEGLAIRHGLPATASGRLKVISTNSKTAVSLSDPESLKVGDTVVVPEVPIWTNVVAKRHLAADRAAIVALLADALKCGKEAPEECLEKREVTLLDRASVPKREPEPDAPSPRPSAPATAPSPTTPPPTGSLPKRPANEPPATNPPATLPRPSPSIPTPPTADAPVALPKPAPKLPVIKPSIPIAEPGAAGAAGRGGRPTVGVFPRSASTGAEAAIAPTMPAAAAPPPPPLPPPAPPPPPPAVALGAADAAAPPTVPVAPEQWPYDVKLLAKILSDVADKVDHKATIGIADGGLADATGGPLPTSAFAPSEEEINRLIKKLKEPDQADNDGNEYVDDLFGAGLKRLSETDQLGELLGTGDMGLCGSAIQADLATWPPEVLTQASHGTVVTSIAAALGVRTAAPEAAAALPKLIFYRMLDNACAPAADLNVSVAEIFSAYEYLANRRARVISISYKVDDATGRSLRDLLKPRIPNLNGLLLIAAGNQNLKLDDEAAVCPACLGHSSDERGGSAAKRTIVVGAATRSLRREPMSNYGKDTVKLFAPGDPTTGIDLLVNSVPSSLSSTSFAAPYAALAAALIGSFKDLNTWDHVRDRLEAAVWPLHDSESGAEATGVGVVDLVKAAAVLHDAIEVKEQDGLGGVVRRTYVGTLLTPLDGQVCPGHLLDDVKVHALRLADPAADGSRRVRVHHRRKLDPGAPWKRKVDVLPACRPAGDLRLRTVFGEEKTFSLTDVTHIQLRWIRES